MQELLAQHLLSANHFVLPNLPPPPSLCLSLYHKHTQYINTFSSSFVKQQTAKHEEGRTLTHTLSLSHTQTIHQQLLWFTGQTENCKARRRQNFDSLSLSLSLSHTHTHTHTHRDNTPTTLVVYWSNRKLQSTKKAELPPHCSVIFYLAIARSIDVLGPGLPVAPLLPPAKKNMHT